MGKITLGNNRFIWENTTRVDGFQPLRCVVYLKGERYHREDDLPAYLYFDADDNTLVQEEYYIENLRHRDYDLPSVVHYTEGRIDIEEYYFNGIKTRDGYKPAVIHYDFKGNITKKQYWVNGRMKDTIEYDRLACLNKRKKIINNLKEY